MTGWIDSRSPQDPTDVIGTYAVTSADVVLAAVDGARDAQRRWWRLGAAGRAAELTGAASALRERRAEAIALVVREVGKPQGEAAGEVARAISILDYFAQACFADVGRLYPPSQAGLLYSERRPHGVAGLITPWNFPLAIPLWKAAPALACGNAVVLKPSPESIACAVLLAEVLGERVPFTVLPGGAETGAALVAAADVVSFTGSAAVGRHIAVAAAQRGVPVQCEMGGQNAAIVLPDADPGSTAALIAAAAMGYAGQKCTATRRVIVVGEQPEFVAALAEAVRELRAGDPSVAGTLVGPVITAAARDAVTAAVVDARSAGGRVLAGGDAGHRDGWFVAPTLVAELPADHRLWQEETFGPLAVVGNVSSVDGAIALANETRYGLVASVHGRDLDALLTVADRLDTGLVKINSATTGVDFYAPFGGEKDSSVGPREQGTAALDFYSSTRTVTVAPHGTR